MQTASNLLKVACEYGVKPSNKVMRKEQFNTRIPEPLKRATSTVAAALDWTKEDVTEVALAALLGSKDKLILAKKEKIQEKAKELALSFERAGRQPTGMEIAA